MITFKNTTICFETLQEFVQTYDALNLLMKQLHKNPIDSDNFKTSIYIPYSNTEFTIRIPIMCKHDCKNGFRNIRNK